MRTVRNAMLVGVLVAEVVLSGSLWALTTGAVKGIDIIIKKKPGGSNMVCMSGGNPCSPDQVRELASALGRNGINVSLAGSDGSLKCATRDGKPCTDDHVGQVQAAGRAVTTKGNSGALVGSDPSNPVAKPVGQGGDEPPKVLNPSRSNIKNN